MANRLGALYNGSRCTTIHHFIDMLGPLDKSIHSARNPPVPTSRDRGATVSKLRPDLFAAESLRG